MKLSLKDLVKLIAPYLVAIGGVVGVYADGKTTTRKSKERFVKWLEKKL